MRLDYMTSLLAQWRRIRCRIGELQAELSAAEPNTPSSVMCDLLIAGEDRRFYHHPGVDPLAIARAVWRTYFCGRREGGSTIAMQLVRTLSGRYERTWDRKLLEIVLAVLVTLRTERDSIPRLYLWCAYYGSGMNGFRQACGRLRAAPRQMRPDEEARFVARLKYPEPKSMNPERRRQIVVRGTHLLKLCARHR